MQQIGELDSLLTVKIPDFGGASSAIGSTGNVGWLQFATQAAPKPEKHVPAEIRSPEDTSVSPMLRLTKNPSVDSSVENHSCRRLPRLQIAR